MENRATKYVQQDISERYISSEALKRFLRSEPHEFGEQWSIKTRYEIHQVTVKRKLTQKEIIELQYQSYGQKRLFSNPAHDSICVEESGDVPSQRVARVSDLPHHFKTIDKGQSSQHVPDLSKLKTSKNGPVESRRPEQKVLSSAQSASSVANTSTSESELSFAGAGAHAQRTLSQADGMSVQACNFIDELATRLAGRALRLRDQNSIRNCPASHTGSVGSSPQSTEKCAQATSSKRAIKRSCQNREEDEDSEYPDDQRGNRLPPAKRERISNDRPTRLFACPYAKFDPERYSERNQTEKRYRKCTSKYLPTIARLKQHLYRTHMRPSWYCGSCYKSFETREEMNQHNRQRPPCEQRDEMYGETMTDEQFREVKRRSPNKNDRESWYKIFQILFPDAQQPLSPYVSTSDAAAVQHFVNLFRWFGPEEFFNLLRDRRERGDGTPEFEVSTQAVVDEAFEIAITDYLERPDRLQNAQHLTDTVTVGSQHSESRNTVLDLTESSQIHQLSPPFAHDPSLSAFPNLAADSQYRPQVNQAVPDLPALNPDQDALFDPSEVDSAFDAYDFLTDIDFLTNNREQASRDEHTTYHL